MKAVVDALVEAGFTFELEPDGVAFIWNGEGNMTDATIGGRPAIEFLRVLKGATPRQWVAWVLGGGVCGPLQGVSGSHGSGLPFSMCSNPEVVLPCAVLRGNQTFEDWESAYMVRAEEHSGYFPCYQRLTRYFGDHPVDRIKAALRPDPALRQLAGKS